MVNMKTSNQEARRLRLIEELEKLQTRKDDKCEWYI